jgi:hypothetical protein
MIENYKNFAIHISENIIKFMDERHCDLQVNIFSGDVLNGYGCRFYTTVQIRMPVDKCRRCGYNSLFAREKFYTSKCKRHSYDYDLATVFRWTENYQGEIKTSLQTAFDQFLDINEKALKGGKTNIKAVKA